MKKPEWKIIKAIKNHSCEGCNELILKGEMYDLLSFRAPKFDEKDKQIGIEFIKIRSHLAELNCHWPDECKKGNHKEHYYTNNNPESPDYGDTKCYCTECATDLSDIEPI